MTDTQPGSTLRALITDRLGRLSIRSAQIIVVTILISAIVFALIQLRLVIIPVLLAVILASAFAPFVAFLRRRRFSPLAAAWVTLLTALILLGGAFTLIALAVRRQWNDLVESAAAGFDELLAFIRNGPLPLDDIDLDVDSLRDSAIEFATTSQFGSGAVAGVALVSEFLAGLVLLLVILFFILKDGDRIWEFFLRPFDGERLARGRRVGRTAVTTFGGYVRGTTIVALVDAVAIGAGLAILGVPLALPLAAIVFLAAYVPLVGATVAGILAALVALVANGPVVALIVVVIVVAVNQLEGDLLQPIVLSQALKLHPLAVLLALTAGTILGGITGAILSVPIAAVAWAVVKTWSSPTPSAPAQDPKGRRGLFRAKRG